MDFNNNDNVKWHSTKSSVEALPNPISKYAMSTEEQVLDTNARKQLSLAVTDV